MKTNCLIWFHNKDRDTSSDDECYGEVLPNPTNAEKLDSILIQWVFFWHKKSYIMNFSYGDYMKCPFCKADLIEGKMVCPECRGWVIDFDYPDNMDKMKEKYSKYSLLELSEEKLTFEEIVTVYTYIERADHFYGDSETSEECSSDGTFSNLYKRLKELNG